MRGSVPKRWDIGERTYEAYKINISEPSRTHWHSCFLLTLIVEGEGEQIVNEKNVAFSEGSVMILSPADFHSTVALHKNTVAYAVKFSDRIFYDSLAEVCQLSDFPMVAHLDDKHFETAKALFQLLFDEQQHTLPASNLFAINLIEELVILTLRASGKEDSETASGMITRALAYIHCNFRSRIKAADVAKHVGYSPNYFSAEFKKQTGMEFQKYLRDSRLEFAKKLLLLSQLSVTEVCFECGFHTHQHFSRAFKNKFGVTPESMKEKSNEKSNVRNRPYCDR